MTLAEYVDIWLRTRTARLAPNARRAYRSALVHHVLPALGHLELLDVTTAVIRAWLIGLHAAPTNTVKSYLAALSTVLTDALIDGLVGCNPAHGAGRRILAGPPQRAPKAMTPPQWVQQQLGHAHYAITVDLYGSWLRQRRPDLTAILDREPAAHGLIRAERAKVIPIRAKR